eukprot:TRINITY_DN148_c0_g1_i1.p1 TRINITY_DN148_c0_g1~~TRINITY_DN148_c0_g1_i1.p1  ORF type:complete len:388 (-),score=105.55 TRINITY_DN148_c0_g1_i1:65-1228(-)
MQRERGFQRGRPGRSHGVGRGGHGRGRGEDRRGLLKAQGGVKKAKPASVKNQIRSIERLLRTTLAPDVKATQEAKLAELRKVVDAHAQSDLERKLAVRYHKIKFFERRKVERRIRRTERALRGLSDAGPEAQEQQAELSRQLAQLKEDLEYVRFFPKDQKYIALFAGGDDEAVQQKRQEMRGRVKANIAAAKAAQIDLEEASGSEGEDGMGDMSDDDFFMKGDISDVDADDEWTDISPREDSRGNSARGGVGGAALPLDPVMEDEEGERERGAVAKGKQAASQRGRGGRPQSGGQHKQRGGGGGAGKPQHVARGGGRGGGKGRQSTEEGGAAPMSIEKFGAGVGGKSGSGKRPAVQLAPQEGAGEQAEEEMKKRKRTRPKKKRKSNQ